MLGIIFKFILMFSLSFIILSFDINNKPIFYHITQITGPLGKDVQRSFGKSVKRSIKNSKKLSKELFNNSEPKYYNDIIESSQSSMNKKITKEMILEDIKRDEARKLDELIRNN